MAGYTCVKCGETASSKCVKSRNVFPNDQRASLLTWILKEEFEPRPNGGLLVHIIGTVPEAHQNVPHEELMWELIELIRKEPEEHLRHWVCNHEWRLDSDQCDLGCCKKV